MLDVRYWLRDLAFGNSPLSHARPELAAKWSDTAADKLPADPVLEVSLGMVAYRNQHLKSALGHCNRAIELDPANDESYAVRGIVYGKQGKYDEAITEYAQALERNPRNAWSWCERGKILMDHFHRNREALADFDQAIAIEPIPHFYRQRSAVHLRLQQYAAAQVDFDALLKSAEADLTINHYAALLSAKLEDMEGYKAQCRTLVDSTKATAKPIEKHFAAWTCALSTNAVEDYTNAIALGRADVEAEPTNLQFQNGLGAILMRAGMYADAKPNLEGIVNSAESEATSKTYTHYLLALTKHHLGQADAARVQLKIAHELSDKELAESAAWNRRLTIELLRKEAQALIGEVDK